MKREQALLQTQVAGLMQNNTVLKDKVMQLEQNLTTLRNTDFSLDVRNQTSHLEKALQIANNCFLAFTSCVTAFSLLFVICKAFSKWLVSLRKFKQHFVFSMALKSKSKYDFLKTTEGNN
jgi:hypothetical protein